MGAFRLYGFFLTNQPAANGHGGNRANVEDSYTLDFLVSVQLLNFPTKTLGETGPVSLTWQRLNITYTSANIP